MSKLMSVENSTSLIILSRSLLVENERLIKKLKSKQGIQNSYKSLIETFNSISDQNKILKQILSNK